MTDVIETVLPKNKKRTALEEAEYEDEDDESALDREMMLQCKFPNNYDHMIRIYCNPSFPAMETLRVYRPRVVVHGPHGMGQRYIAAAALHHLEGYHVQSLDLGTLMSDSTRVRHCIILMCLI